MALPLTAVQAVAFTLKGCGTVFSVTTSGTETTLRRFGLGYGDNGSHPYAGLIALHGTTGPSAQLLRLHRVLYGTTEFGGAYNDGMEFSVTP
jgi:hypothetical protein